jgi:hypothetical protein
LAIESSYSILSAGKKRQAGDNGHLDPHVPNDMSIVLSLLSEESLDENNEFRPLLKPEFGGIVYSFGSVTVPYEKLRVSEKKGLLKSRGFTSFSICPECESLNLRTELACPDCKSRGIVKSDLMIHYECQNTGPIEEFQSNIRNGYFCQKCRKELKRVGIDYGNPGIGFKCSNCEKVFQFPLVLSQCDANHVSKIDELELKGFPNYVVSKTAKGLSTLLIDTHVLQDLLGKNSIKSQILCQLRGASGANHVVPMLLTAPDRQEIAIEFIHGESQSELEQAMFQLLLKSADLTQIKKMLVILEGDGSIDKFAGVANPLKIKIIASKDPRILYEQILKEAVQ